MRYVLRDGGTGIDVEPGMVLESSNGEHEWRYLRVHTAASERNGGAVSVRNVSTGRKSTIAVESFPRLYIEPVSDHALYAVVDSYDWGFIRWAHVDEALSCDETIDQRIAYRTSPEALDMIADAFRPGQ